MTSWHFPLVRIPQRDEYGCGIACVATVCGVTYERARYEFFPKQKFFRRSSKDMMVDSSDMLPVIRRLGFSCVVRNGFKEHKLPAIVFLDWAHGKNTHAVVWDPFRECFHDPGYDWPLSSRIYMRNWRRARYSSVIITGKRRT